MDFNFWVNTVLIVGWCFLILTLAIPMVRDVKIKKIVLQIEEARKEELLRLLCVIGGMIFAFIVCRWLESLY